MADVFDFSDYQSFLRASQRRHPQTKRAITLEDWAKRLKYKSPRSIAMVIKGQRVPSRDLVEAFAKDLNLDTNRQRYFELLVLQDKHEAEGQQLEQIHLALEELNHKKLSRRILDDRKFSTISEWYYLVLRALIVSPGFQESPQWIAKRLRSKLNAEQVKTAIANLVRYGFLIRHESTGELQMASDSNLWTETDVPSIAIRRHHAQMMQRAVEALSEQSVEHREFISSTMQMERGKIKEAKSVLREFQESFYKRFATDKGNAVFQFSLQFFEHTDPDIK